MPNKLKTWQEKQIKKTQKKEKKPLKKAEDALNSSALYNNKNLKRGRSSPRNS